MENNVTVKEKRGFVAYIKAKWKTFTEWYFSDWTIKDHLAWFGFWSLFWSFVVNTIKFFKWLHRLKK